MPSINLSIAVDTSGIDAAIAGLRPKLERIVAKYAFKIERSAKVNAPYRHGVLRGSIATTLNGLEAEIGTSVEYAVYQEFGFHHVGSGEFIQHPFMAPAVAEHGPAFIAEVEAALG